ncbi:MAG: ATP-dependent helicase [Rothia mucilaginosa]|uniref:DNA 3'-5' helicase n=1 Tax=Rothia mucilaginosa TaxID=43675 RepID=A0A930PQ36_9MICC|nr:ATP-dependent DNA helicase [Rothia mucilaginosa]MBF1663113.1 ATP-dependent helicase [Rothia mucilaginosa]
MTDSGAYGATNPGATTPGAHPGSGTGMLTPAQWCEHNSWQLPNGTLFSAEAAGNDPALKPADYRSALDIAEMLNGADGKKPTPEQVRMIEAGPAPTLVIAGAGSGKTATMVDRVIWLVDNGFVRPEEVLGVTFTRKAATELRSRMRAGLNTLRRSRRVAPTDEELREGIADPTVLTYHSYANNLVKEYGLRLGVEQDAQMLGDAQKWQLAAQIVQYWEGELPLDKDGVPVSAATMINQMLQLSDECAEHLVEPQQVIDFCTEQLAAYAAVPEPRRETKTERDILKVQRLLRNRRVYARMAMSYARVKARMQVLDFGDLMRFAARIAEADPAIREGERARFKVVLLDEFQDTSHAQMSLFSSIYGADEAAGIPAHPVMAVGDPKQSIYGFRGASDGQMFSFYRHFPTKHVRPLFLSIAWRNDISVLNAANHVAEKLKEVPEWVRAADGDITAAQVPDLRPRCALVGEPGSPAFEQAAAGMVGRVDLTYHDSDREEAVAIAERIAAMRAQAVREYERAYAAHRSGDGSVRPRLKMPEIAVLARVHGQLDPIRVECERLGIPVQQVGLGGLLSQPEVVDLVSALRVLADPNRSDALARLLTGARWRLGAADMLALGDWAQSLVRERERALREQMALRMLAEAEDADDAAAINLQAEHLRAAQERLDETLKGAVEDSSGYASLIEAVENLPQDGADGEPLYGEQYRGRRFSPAALERLRAFAEQMRVLRAGLSEDLGTLLYEIERTMLLDIELAVRPGTDPLGSRANLDAFHEVAAAYGMSAPRINAMIYAGSDGVSAEEGDPGARRFLLSSGGVSYVMGFLAWLERADDEEKGLALGAVEPDPNAVQLMTMHAAKGLEWDHVLLPGLCGSATGGQTPNLWQMSANAALPWPLRGDREYLPSILETPEEITAFEKAKDLEDYLGEHKDDAAEHAGMEDRRLMYVAMTRARNLLALSAYRWKSAAMLPLPVQPFWEELMEMLFKSLFGPNTPMVDAPSVRFEETMDTPWAAPQLVGMGLSYTMPNPADKRKKVHLNHVRRWAEQLAESKYRLVEPVTLVHGTVVDPSNLPPAPDEAALLKALELYPVDADELTPVQAEASANARATYAEQVQRYAWALVEVMAPALAQDWQLAAPSARARTVAENCTRLNLPVPEWIIEATEREKWREAQPPQPGFSPTVAAALPIKVRGQFAQKNYEDRNPNMGAVLTAMWPFDPLERPVIWRWASDDALNRGTEAVLRRGQHEQLEREIAINSSSRREAVERAALAVELAVGAGEDDVHQSGDVSGESTSHPATAVPAVHGESAIPESLRQQAVDWEREADLLLLMMGQTDPVLSDQLPGHLSASTFIRLSEDPQGTVHQLMRPVPQRPSRAATIGTAVHALIEEHFGVAPTADPLEAPDAEDTVGVDLPGSAAASAALAESADSSELADSSGSADPADLQEQDEFTFEDDFEESESELDASVQRLWERFATSEWGSDEWKDRIWAVEYPVETHIEGVSLRGRIDAVFRTEDEDGERWVLVDWKSGSRPKMATMQSRRFQLGLYRIAFSRIMGVDPERISTVFVYLGGKGVAEVWDHQIRGGLPTEAQLAKVIREARKG